MTAAQIILILQTCNKDAPVFVRDGVSGVKFEVKNVEWTESQFSDKTSPILTFD